MSLLDTIEIQGVRSIGIGSQNAAVVEFLSPLTIICGSNGSGKTTIIESLKYATTGDLPPGKMPVFIHDYRLANRNRVDSLVKLKFNDIRGRSCIVTRRMTARVEGGKGKLVTKSEEATIAVQNDSGDWKSLSSKVGDMKKEILNLLGVPTAILEYVVFCHQEESTWPLDEPKKLKERFDEIFQVTSYVKSIDALKKIQKQNQQDLRTLEGVLPHLIKQQESKMKLENDFNELSSIIKENEREINEKELNKKKQKLELVTARKDVSDAEEAERQCSSFEKEIYLLKEQVNALKTPDYQGTINELMKEVEAYKSALADSGVDYARYEKDRISWGNRINTLGIEVKKLIAEKEQVQKEIDELKAAELMYEKLHEEEIILTDEISLKFSVGADEIEAQLYELLLSSKAELDKTQQRNKEKQLSCQKNIDDLKAELAVLENKIETGLKNFSEVKVEIEKLKENMEEIKTCVEQSEDLKQQIQDAEQHMKKLSVENDVKESNCLREEKNEITLKISCLKEECREWEAVENIFNVLDAKKKEFLNLEIQLDSLVKKHKTALQDVFNMEEPEFPLKGHISNVLIKVSKAVGCVEEVMRKEEEEKTKLRNDIKHLNERMEQLSDDIYSYRGRIEKVVPFGDSAETRLEEVKSLLNKSRSDLSLIDGCRYLYEKWETEVKERKCCPLCEKKYKNIEETKELIAKVSRKKSEFPTEIKKYQRRILEYEELQKELIEVIPYTTLLKDLQGQKSNLELELEAVEKSLSDLERKTEKSAQEKELLSNKHGLILSVQADASLMDNIWETHKSIQKQIKALSTELEGRGGRKSVPDLRKELNDSENRYNEIIGRIDAMQAKVDEKNKFAEKLNDLRAKYLRIGKKAMVLETFEKKLTEKETEKENHLMEVAQLKKAKPDVMEKLQEKIGIRDLLLEQVRAEEKHFSSRINEIEFSVEKLSNLRKKIQEVQDGSRNLAAKQSILSDLLEKIEKKNEECRVLSTKLDDVNTQQERGRRLEDQLRKMKLRERILDLFDQKKKKEWKGKSLNDLKEIVYQKERQWSEMERGIERKRGEIEQKKVQFAEMKRKLSSKEFVGSEDEYKRSIITKCVTEKVIEDLTMYIRVLDESVVKFHMQKMEEINEVLSHLWDQVYRGSDIETIQIKSESVEEGEKRKSYNYRVVMTVDGSEIDMPGRCSAGQKMLASILIRIALSDVFCDKCSIIALDEPTTNLDVLKVENLGDMLAQIIEARCNMNRKNFQLIVITHDDRFVEHLRQLCRPDWVYALSKDGSGLSKVKRHRTLQDAGMH